MLHYTILCIGGLLVSLLGFRNNDRPIGLGVAFKRTMEGFFERDVEGSPDTL